MSVFDFVPNPAYMVRNWLESHIGGSFLIAFDTFVDSMLGVSVIEAFGAIFALALFTIVVINMITFVLKAVVGVIKIIRKLFYV